MLDTTLAEGLQIESEQFARLAWTPDLAQGLRRWEERRRTEAPAG